MPVRDDAHRRRAKRQPALRAGGPRASRCRVTCDDRRGQPRFLALPELRRGEPAGEAVAAVLGAKAKVGGAPAGKVEPGDPVPPRPAAVAVDGEGDRPAGPEHRSGDSAGRGGEPDVEIEAVAVGLGVEEERERVAAVLHRRLEADQGPAGADVRLAGEARDARLPGHRLADPELGDVETSDMDVEAGQDRPRLARSA